MTGSPTERRERTLARTYGPDASGWDRVQEYRRVQEYLEGRASVTPGTVAAQLDLPRGRVRPWVEGDTRPDPVRAIQLAWDLGWLGASPGDATFESLAVCHAWIFGGGSIATKNYRPTFAVESGDPERTLLAALETLGLGHRRYREDAEDRATEIAPADHAVVLGRYLAGVLEAPTGSKNDERVLSLPLWLSTTPERTRRRWARTYVRLRGHVRDDRDGAVQVVERRPDSYRESLRDFLADLVDCPDSVRATGDNTLYLDPPAATELYTTPRLETVPAGVAADD